ncbi:hypothetical protein N7478_000783 [Penicillium angulare]|uniref:uncharacterized protein n=1 Tax=Penicillium angulare TaxID=116970 RepID=UPI00253F8328|nr:uncharacterized protein N7478_000691 [Penicillium angulare]XP_056784878.1 uncharacterized protein N7478_000783 [Penicillium angulare]KAJ5291440.1 hypothetical protein N7478_000691 [Penicillium angulare]KAJ5291532.1 hypothetical protein N7478_000783 [Penicillium angulare]
MKADLLNIIHTHTAYSPEKQELPAGEHGTTSRTRSTDTDCAVIEPTTTISQDPDFRVIKSRKKKDHHKIHRRCFEVVSQFDDEFKKLIEERDEQRHQDHKLIQRLRDENRKDLAKLRQNTAEKEKAWAEKLILETEVRQLRQRLKHSHSSEDSQASLAAIQPMLRRVHNDVSASMNDLWDTIKTAQK